MKILYVPFYSQQDKRKGKFLLETDSAFRMYRFMAERSVEAGWQAALAIPVAEQCADNPRLPGPCVRLPRLPLHNLDRRLHWDVEWIRQVASTYDVVVTSHETLPYPLRCCNPALKIVVEAAFLPNTGWSQTEELVKLATSAADAVHVNSTSMAAGHERAFRWQFAYDAQELSEVPQPAHRSVDVVFGHRASSTEYSNHTAFMGAVKGTPLIVSMPDPTSYLRETGKGVGVPAEPLTRKEYLSLLKNSRVVTGLINHGGLPFGFVEAIACGCTPVALGTAPYAELLGTKWLYLCSLESLRFALMDAARYGSPWKLDVSMYSYQSAWTVAKHDLEELCNSTK